MLSALCVWCNKLWSEDVIQCAYQKSGLPLLLFLCPDPLLLGSLSTTLLLKSKKHTKVHTVMGNFGQV